MCFAHFCCFCIYQGHQHQQKNISPLQSTIESALLHTYNFHISQEIVSLILLDVDKEWERIWNFFFFAEVQHYVRFCAAVHPIWFERSWNLHLHFILFFFLANATSVLVVSRHFRLTKDHQQPRSLKPFPLCYVISYTGPPTLMTPADPGNISCQASWQLRLWGKYTLRST